MTSKQKGKAKTTQPVISFLSVFFFFLVLLLFVFRATLIQRSDVSPCTEGVLSDPPSSNSNSASDWAEMNLLRAQLANPETVAARGKLAQRDKNKMADQRHGERTTRGDRSLRGPWVSRLSPGSHGDKAFRYLPRGVVYGDLFPLGRQKEAWRGEQKPSRSRKEIIGGFSAFFSEIATLA